jgi:hypothetical protein
MAATEQVSSVRKAFRNAASKDKTRLITADQKWDNRLKPVGKHLGQALDRSILESDRPEIPSFASIILFRKKNKVGAVDALKVSRVSIKSLKEVNNTLKSSGPSGLEEGRAKAIRAGAGIRVHAANSNLNLSSREGCVELLEGERPFRVEGIQAEGPASVSGAPH